MRKYSIFDSLIIKFNSALQTISGQGIAAQRINPAAHLPEPALSASEKIQSARLMRVNHSGEVCAQALYQGQALTARVPKIRTQLETAAQEEKDHLAWCEQRLNELHSHTSYLNPLWYVGSLAIGALSGLAGDKISLGFLAETEYQVEQHLSSHLSRLPAADIKSRNILDQMRQDEIQHAHHAQQAGGIHLPLPVKILMGYMSKVMTVTAYWL